MKITKNILFANIVLAIALCTSMQVTAMEPEQKTNQSQINPYLSEQDKADLKWQIMTDEKLFTDLYDPKKSNNPWGYNAALLSAQIRAHKAVYYGDRPYTRKEMAELVHEYVTQAKREFGR